MNFFQTVNEKMQEGKAALEYGIKTILYQQEPELFDLLDFNDSTIFQEPLLYTYYNLPAPRMKLSQILYGYIQPSLRPSRLEVATDADGVVFLPNIGYFETDISNSELVMHYNNNQFSFVHHDSPVNTSFSPINYIKGTNIELCSRSNILIRQFFDQANSGDVGYFSGAQLTTTTAYVDKAFAIVKKNFPLFYEMLKATVRRIVIFKSPTQRSFASLQVNGAAFFNIKDHDDEVFILEDITHQCGHVIYYAVAHDKQTYLEKPGTTPLNLYTGIESDKRSVLNAFYALLPYCFSNYCSKLCDDNNVFEGRQQHEFLGRFAFRMRKFTIDIKNFSAPGIFTQKGNKFFKGIKSVHKAIDDEKRTMLDNFDVSTQQYEFSYERFLQVNPANVLHAANK